MTFEGDKMRTQDKLHPRFLTAIEGLAEKFELLMTMEPARSLKDIPLALAKAGGVYLFSGGDEHLYVGRTGRLRERYSDHSRPGSDMNTAPFAVLLARDQTKIAPTYSGPLVRRHLRTHEAFGPAFEEAKARIGGMSFRYVQEDDDVRQMLLECYVALALGTRYNDFGNH